MGPLKDLGVPTRTNKVALILCGGDINFSDLPIITNRSNAMIPINGKPVVGWIFDDLLAKGVTEAILVLRFDNFKLLNYVEWAFGGRITLHFAFVQPGGTILHSFLAGLAWVRPGSGVHVILGDTLLRDKWPIDPDFIFAGDYENPEDWCLVDRDAADFAVEYFDKVDPHRRNLLAVAGVYSFSNTPDLRDIIIKVIKMGGHEISDVLRKYGQSNPIKVVQAAEWYDFGHINYFNLAKRRLLQSRYFNSLEIDPVLGTITKRSEKNEKLSNELAWYRSLPGHLQMIAPRLIEKQDKEGVSITQEYYGYPNLAELYVFGDMGLSVWMNAIKKLIEVHLLFRKEKGTVNGQDVRDMYWVKTKQRFDELSSQGSWAEMLTKDSIKINGRKYLNFHAIEKKVASRIDTLAAKVNGCIIHGDYCFSNILYDLNSQLVKVIDPRGSFGEQKIHGDPRYDIAKLRHSVSGRYDFIMADLFKVSKDNEGNFSLSIFTPEHYNLICAFFDDMVEQAGYNRNDIVFIEGLLFLSMVPLHKDAPQRQLAMYLNGLIIINQAIDDENSN